MKKKRFALYHFIKQVIAEFIDDNVLKYSASLAYYTVFSLAPMLIIMITICGALFGKEAIEGRVYVEIKDLVGGPAAMQIQDTIKNIHLTKNSPFASVFSIIVLIIGGTSIFGEIQDSLNKIWGLKVIAKKAWWKLIINRLLSFSLIISLGFVFIVSLLLNALISVIGIRLNNVLSGVGKIFIPLIDNVLSFSITTLLFAIIFKVLPDAKIKWKDITIGAFVTAILFTLGKWGIGYYLGRTNLASIYGAAGSVIIIMLWAYYSSVILYLGAEFTKVYANEHGASILPSEYSEWIKIKEIPVQEVTLKKEV
ncbi:YihY/virulence factor BrkB family protein [Ferruginibacter sp.]|uniref:YihY/virulence factor BrkB family protein n=1 Tax=Ferruginibacter sp. TaxID=1940288 RepID=UPI0019A7D672|nr:YihY/virulence factor BrkB family protein [Ferruginibacter sp.]MBC7626280.1 YihY/virulence factor BrkB family protein [Ferruginibacter sp.]